ncbi:carboxypeptidase-like regulatory domain-containing protein [Aureliella helgolandensis]|uniref:Carboxypeptidase regulatory-like domain-containing protein n=1 Tax=Aureliella helgolandensis TaxID=2527968 RepID=A0A518FZI4_9BACT|nr:carboxypeptidase-like regulatory domain-containing protein [Aureliella helgolandensis]QDV21769.1 hypothetical protein Q31a_00480 [Aureliella helgolandensis]
MLGGCSTESNPPTYPVTGTVTYKGAPVDGATIIFTSISEGGEGATGKSDAEGKYSLTTYVNGDGARPGDYMIKVFKFDSPPPPPSESSPDFNPDSTLEEEEESYDPTEIDNSPVKNELPVQYSKETTSGLKHTVGESESSFDIVLD